MLGAQAIILLLSITQPVETLAGRCRLWGCCESYCRLVTVGKSHLNILWTAKSDKVTVSVFSITSDSSHLIAPVLPIYRQPIWSCLGNIIDQQQLTLT